MTPLRGTWGTALLPIRADESIDFSALEAELDVLLDVGLAGVYTCGTAGEFHTLDEGEFDELSELVANKAKRAHAAFQIGASWACVPISQCQGATADKPHARAAARALAAVSSGFTLTTTSTGRCAAGMRRSVAARLRPASGHSW